MPQHTSAQEYDRPKHRGDCHVQWESEQNHTWGPENITMKSKESQLPKDDQTSHPIEPPPVPPKTRTLTSLSPPKAASEGYDTLNRGVRPKSSEDRGPSVDHGTPRPVRPAAAPPKTKTSTYLSSIPVVRVSQDGVDNGTIPLPTFPRSCPMHEAMSPQVQPRPQASEPQSSSSGEDGLPQDDQNSRHVNPPPIPPKIRTLASLSPTMGPTMGPKPLPRPRLPQPHPTYQSPSLSASCSTVKDEEQRSSGSSMDHQTLRPVRPAPPPPRTRSSPSLSPSLMSRESSDTISGRASPSPAVPHPVYETMSPPLPLRPQAYENRVMGAKPPDTDGENLPDPPPRPRPVRPPWPPLSHSQTVYEPPPESPDYLTMLAERQPPRVAQNARTQSTRRSSLGLRGVSNSPNSRQGRSLTPFKDDGIFMKSSPSFPPPPSFRPPPPPGSSRLSHPTSIYHSVSEQRVYLEISPDETGPQVSPSGQPIKQNLNSSYYSIPRLTLPRSQSEPNYKHLHFSPGYQNTMEVEDFDNLTKWWKMVDNNGFPLALDNMSPSLYGLSLEEETRRFNQKALQVRMGLGFFHSLLLKRGESLQVRIAELQGIAGNLDKVHKKSKTMGIAGGTTGAVGGVAAVVGIALAPMTMGISLIATAVGAGVVIAGGGMRAGATIKNKKNTSVDRRLMERAVQGYQAEVSDVERCLSFVHAGMDELRRHDMARLPGACAEAVRTGRVADAVYRSGSLASQTHGMSLGILKGFTIGMDFYFTDGQKLKKGSEIKFASMIRAMAKQLQEGLDNINKAWETFSWAANIA